MDQELQEEIVNCVTEIGKNARKYKKTKEIYSNETKTKISKDNTDEHFKLSGSTKKKNGKKTMTIKLEKRIAILKTALV